MTPQNKINIVLLNRIKIMANFSSLIANCNYVNFNEIAVEIFQFQAKYCTVLRQYISEIGRDPKEVDSSDKIIYLPISFFKSHRINSLETNPDFYFKSSGTTGLTSKHYINDLKIYEQSFVRHFNHAFERFAEYCHLALLPNYLQQGNSSLVYQVNHFIEKSQYKGAFYMDDFAALAAHLKKNNQANIPTILWGVSYALLDFIEHFQIDWNLLIVIETGGMKGRRKEIIRSELHEHLQNAFPSSTISSEYGMTELFSQAYWNVNEQEFQSHPTMQVTIRDPNDPFTNLGNNRHGAINVIDINNWQTCSFIETEDLGIRNNNGGFNVLGRMDQAETRGCSLMYTE